jgi:hypothetical protein
MSGELIKKATVGIDTDTHRGTQIHTEGHRCEEHVSQGKRSRADSSFRLLKEITLLILDF